MKPINWDRFPSIQYGQGEGTERAYIENSLDEVVRRLNENMGINDKVADKAYEISKEIRKCINKNDGTLQYVRGYDDGSERYWFHIKKEYIFDETNKTDGLDINVSVFYYPDRQTYRDHYHSHEKETSVSTNWNEFNLVVDVIGKYIVTDSLEDAVQHELEHHFQNLKIGHDYNVSDDYQMLMRFKHDNNKVISEIGDVLYLAYKFEQEGFANGLYAFLRHERPEDRIELWNVMKENAMFQFYLRFKTEIGNVFKNSTNPDMLRSIQQYGFASYKKFEKYIMERFDSFCYRMNRTILKYEYDRDAGRFKEITEYINKDNMAKRRGW